MARIGRGRRWRLTAAAGAALATLAALSPGAQARDATVRSFDQTAISMHFFPAEGLAAGQRAPTVLVGPGWSMTGGTDQN